MTQAEVLNQILEQQVKIANSLEKISECLVYITGEQIANEQASKNLRWLGDGQDEYLG